MLTTVDTTLAKLVLTGATETGLLECDFSAVPVNPFETQSVKNRCVVVATPSG